MARRFDRRFMQVALILFLISVVSLAPRIALIFRDDSIDSLRALPDQMEYLELGQSLHDEFRLEFFDPRFGESVRAFRVPGYPALVALCDANVKAVRAVQSILGAGTALAAYFIALRWLSHWRAICAGLFVALDPIHAYFSSLVLSETLFTFIVTWGIAAIVWGDPPTRFIRSRIPSLFWWIGIALLALAVLVRTTALPLALMAGIASAISVSPESTRRLRRPMAIWIVLITILVISPWAIRNRMLLGSWIFTSTNDGFTLYDGFNPDATGASDQSFVAQIPGLRTMNEVERNRALVDRARKWAMENPVRSIELAGIKIARTWSPIPLSNQFGSSRFNVIVSAIHSVPLMVLGMIGLFIGKIPVRSRWTLLVPILLVTISAAMTVGSMRYRIPAHPMLAVLAVSVGLKANRRADEVEPASNDDMMN